MNNTKGLIAYYRSRALRVLPLYYFSIIFCSIVFWSKAQESPLRVLALFTFIENYKPKTGIIFNHVYWTMPVEMLYFISAPFIFFIIKKSIFYIQDWIIFLGVTALFFTLTIFIFSKFPADNTGYNLTRKEWSMIARFDFWYNLTAFILGGICVFIVKNKRYTHYFFKFRNPIKIFTCTSILAIVAYCSTTGLKELDANHVSYFMAFGLTPSIGLFMLSITILNETQTIKPRRKIKQLENLGLLAYGIYLFHMPIYTLLNILFGKIQLAPSNEIMTAIVLLTTVAFSKISYQYIELPFLNLRYRSLNLHHECQLQTKK